MVIDVMGTPMFVEVMGPGQAQACQRQRTRMC